MCIESLLFAGIFLRRKGLSFIKGHDVFLFHPWNQPIERRVEGKFYASPRVYYVKVQYRKMLLMYNCEYEGGRALVSALRWGMRQGGLYGDDGFCVEVLISST